MALVLDAHSRTAIAWRRRRGKEDRLYVRFERCSMRAGVPWVLAVGWLPACRPGGDLVLEHAGDAEAYLDCRVARYVRSHDLTVSAAQLGPFRWLVAGDPFLAERIRAWEYTHPETDHRGVHAGTSPKQQAAGSAGGGISAAVAGKRELETPPRLHAPTSAAGRQK